MDTMTNEIHTYGGYNVGCMLGTAYQTLVAELSESLSKAGLDVTAAEYLVLRALYDKAGMQQCDIAALLGKDKATISRCIRNMESKGLVTTELVSYKCLKVYASEKARRIEPAIMAVAAARHVALSELLTRHEMETFVNVLKKIISNH